VTGSAPWLASLDDIVAMVPLKMVFHAGCTYRLRLEALLAARGAFGVRRLEFGTLDGIIGCVGAGIGVTLLPRAAATRAAAEGRVALHAPPARQGRVPTVLVGAPTPLFSTALSSFIDLARSWPARGRRRPHIAPPPAWISFH
jgi:DNA-binding transcriptional LysR family regulator